MSQAVHIHKCKKYDKNNILLLLIPIFFFGLILATYVISKGIGNNLQTSLGYSESEVLGDIDK